MGSVNDYISLTSLNSLSYHTIIHPFYITCHSPHVPTVGFCKLAYLCLARNKAYNDELIPVIASTYVGIYLAVVVVVVVTVAVAVVVIVML